MEPNWDIPKLYENTMKPNADIIKMHRGPIGSDLLKVNEILIGYPYDSRWNYFKNQYKPLTFHKTIKKCMGQQ